MRIHSAVILITLSIIMISAGTPVHAYDAKQAKEEFMLSIATLGSGKKWENYYTSENGSQKTQAKEYLKGVLDGFLRLFVANIDQTSQHTDDELFELFYEFGRRNQAFEKGLTIDIFLDFLKRTRMLGDLKDAEFTIRRLYK